MNILPQNEDNITDVIIGCDIIKKYLFMFSAGCVLYPVIEMLFRGHTHFSMSIVGGIVTASLYYCHLKFPTLGIFPKSLIGSLIITVIELISGIVLNIVLKLNVWDYSNSPLNLWGQICLPFSVIWFFLSALFFFLCPYADKILNYSKTE